MAFVKVTTRKLLWKKSRQDIGLRKIRWKTRFWGPFLCQRPRGTRKSSILISHEPQIGQFGCLVTDPFCHNFTRFTAFRQFRQDQTTWLFRTLRKPETERFRTEKYTKQSGKQPGSANRTNREAERQTNLKGATSLPGCTELWLLKVSCFSCEARSCCFAVYSV